MQYRTYKIKSFSSTALSRDSSYHRLCLSKQWLKQRVSWQESPYQAVIQSDLARYLLRCRAIVTLARRLPSTILSLVAATSILCKFGNFSRGFHVNEGWIVRASYAASHITITSLNHQTPRYAIQQRVDSSAWCRWRRRLRVVLV
jgi:hypothetical protein